MTITTTNDQFIEADDPTRMQQHELNHVHR
jgi:hypothetical protein